MEAENKTGRKVPQHNPDNYKDLGVACDATGKPVEKSAPPEEEVSPREREILSLWVDEFETRERYEKLVHCALIFPFVFIKQQLRCRYEETDIQSSINYLLQLSFLEYSEEGTEGYKLSIKAMKYLAKWHHAAVTFAASGDPVSQIFGRLILEEEEKVLALLRGEGVDAIDDFIYRRDDNVTIPKQPLDDKVGSLTPEPSNIKDVHLTNEWNHIHSKTVHHEEETEPEKSTTRGEVSSSLGLVHKQQLKELLIWSQICNVLQEMGDKDAKAFLPNNERDVKVKTDSEPIEIIAAAGYALLENNKGISFLSRKKKMQIYCAICSTLLASAGKSRSCHEFVRLGDKK